MSLCQHWLGATATPELERALGDLVHRAITGAELTISDDVFVPFVAERLGVADLAAISAAPAADLLIACACAAGDTRALARFEHVLAAVRPALAGIGATRDEIEEVLQRLRMQLLVGERPGIARYAGKGELRAWLRVIAVREAVRLLTERGRAQLVDDERMFEAIEPLADVEHDLIKQEYRDAFRAAFAEAMRMLPPRDRMLLRQHTIDDLSIDQLGQLHGVHRATAARWVEQARQELSKATQRLLRERLGVSGTEARDLVRLILSRVDSSVQRLLSEAQE
jgi:RNA polymerase sigma-70 factor (ECF subfamily)